MSIIEGGSVALGGDEDLGKCISSSTTELSIRFRRTNAFDSS
jgi:hypothetical protein